MIDLYYLAAIPAFFIALLVGRLTRESGCIIGTFAALLLICSVVFLMPASGAPWVEAHWSYLILLVLLGPILLCCGAAVIGFSIGRRGRRTED